MVSEIVEGVGVRPRAARAHRATPRWAERSRTVGPAPALAVTDGAAVVAALVVAGWAHVAVSAFLVLALGAWVQGGLYRTHFRLSVLDELPRLVGGVLGAAGATLLGVAVVSPGDSEASTALLRGAGVLVVVSVLLRAALYATMVRLRVRGVLARRAVVVGAGDDGRRLVRVLAQHPEYGVDVIGLVDEQPAGRSPSGRAFSRAVLGDSADLLEVVARHHVSLVLVAAGGQHDTLLETALRQCGALGSEVRVVPRLAQLHPEAAGSDAVWGVPLVRLANAPRLRPSWRLKRILDVVVAASAAVLLGPVILATAAAVRLETGSSVIFRQVRVGADGRLFTLLKFRSLRPVDDTESQTCWSVASDDRVGPVGRVIRALSLDELPQLWNIVRGDMSLVGPRPERPFFVERFSGEVPCYEDRHRAPAGLTGLAAVNGLRGDTSIEDRARFDNAYVEGWSLWLDVTIMLRTVRAVLRRSEGPSDAAIPRQVAASLLEGDDVA